MGIDRIVKERHLLGHPFYQRWQKGKVSLEVLQAYSKQYYHWESSLPSFLEAALDQLPSGSTKDAIAQVLGDETSNPRPHTELWIQFAEGIGVSAKDVRNTDPTPRTTNLVQTYTSLCKRGADEALGAIYAYESQFPEVAKAKGDGLRNFYGISDPKALEFFELHSTLDVEHGKAVRGGFSDSEFTRESAHLALDAWWGMLDQFEALAAS